jgi:nucleotidyltransferase substrate binding protein (TIGR01987 family)
MEERLAYLTDQLSDAIEDLEKALKIDDSKLDHVVADTVCSGRAQKFEFTVELFWKTAKRFLLDIHGFDMGSPKPIIKQYFELGYLTYEDSQKLLKALDIRNALSHTYNKIAFLELHEMILSYAGFFEKAAAGFRGHS